MKLLKKLFGSKKFVVTLGSIVLGAVAAFTGAITWAQFGKFALVVVPTYLGAQGIADIGKGLSEGATDKAIAALHEALAVTDTEVDAALATRERAGERERAETTTP